MSRNTFSTVVNIVCVSEQLRDADKVCLFQIFEPREGPIEILRQVQNLLRYFYDLCFLRFGNLDKFLHDTVRN